MSDVTVTVSLSLRRSTAGLVCLLHQRRAVALRVLSFTEVTAYALNKPSSFPTPSPVSFSGTRAGSFTAPPAFSVALLEASKGVFERDLR